MDLNALNDPVDRARREGVVRGPAQRERELQAQQLRTQNERQGKCRVADVAKSLDLPRVCIPRATSSARSDRDDAVRTQRLPQLLGNVEVVSAGIWVVGQVDDRERVVVQNSLGPVTEAECRVEI